MTSRPSSYWTDDVHKNGTPSFDAMRICLKNIPVKNHLDLIWNDGALDFLEERRANKNNKKMIILNIFRLLVRELSCRIEKIIQQSRLKATGKINRLYFCAQVKLVLTPTTMQWKKQTNSFEKDVRYNVGCIYRNAYLRNNFGPNALWPANPILGPWPHLTAVQSLDALVTGREIESKRPWMNLNGHYALNALCFKIHAHFGGHHGKDIGSLCQHCRHFQCRWHQFSMRW